MTDVFVSYASSDVASVEPIVRALEDHGLDVWWDRNIYAGTAFDREIETAIAAARCVVVVWTKRSVESDWVRAEATEALKRGVLVPIVIGDARPPMPFRGTQAISVDREITDFAAIIRAVDRFVPDDEAQVRRDATSSTVEPSAATQIVSRPRYGRIALMAAGTMVLMVAGLAWLLFPRGESPDVAAAPDMQRIVILPFVVRGNSGLEFLSEGVVDLLATRFDGIPGYHGIDTFTSLTKARSKPESSTDPIVAMEVAREVGAGRFVMGTVVDAVNATVISATIYDSNANAIAHAEAAYQDNVVEAIDDLARRLISDELSAPYESFASMAALTTKSVDALKAYLEGERLFRLGDFRASVHQFQEAIRHDENFALAWFKIFIAAQFVDRDLLLAAEVKANELQDQLTIPQRELLRAYRFGGVGRIREATAAVEALTRTYPDNVEALRFQGEVYFRVNIFAGRDMRESAASFEKILAIDPNDHWARMYLVDLAFLDADSASMRRHLAQLTENPPVRFELLADYIDGKASAAMTAERTAAVRLGALLSSFAIAPRLRDRELLEALHHELALAVGAATSSMRLYEAFINASAGDWSIATTQSWETPEQRLTVAVLAALTESAPRSLKVEAVDWLLDWDSVEDGLEGCEDPRARAQGCDDTAQEAARQFYLFVLLYQLGELEQAYAARDALLALGRDAAPNSIVLALAETAAGVDAAAQNRLRDALQHFQRGRVGVPYLALAGRVVAGLGLLYQPMLAWNRWLTGHTLVELERPQESTRWFRSVAQTGWWYLPWHDDLARLVPVPTANLSHGETD